MYTIISHPLRKAMNLSISEYAVLDSIYHQLFYSSGNRTFSVIYISDELSLTKQGIYKIIERLFNKGFLIKIKDKTMPSVLTIKLMKGVQNG